MIININKSSLVIHSKGQARFEFFNKGSDSIKIAKVTNRDFKYGLKRHFINSEKVNNVITFFIEKTYLYEVRSLTEKYYIAITALGDVKIYNYKQVKEMLWP